VKSWPRRAGLGALAPVILASHPAFRRCPLRGSLPDRSEGRQSPPAITDPLFRSGRRNITKILAASVASFLFPPGPERDRAYNRVAALYEARGNAAHDAQIPESEQLFESLNVGRRTFAKCLELGQTPDCNLLMANWKGNV